MDRIGNSIEDAAKIAGVSRTFLFGEIRDGRLIAKKAGSRTLIPTENLKAWMDSLPAAPTSQRSTFVEVA
jgi:excisionase family DNA binding protein